MRGRIIREALSELAFSERVRIRFEQAVNLCRRLVMNSGILLFLGIQVILFAVLAFRTDPFSDGLVWNVLACVVFSTMVVVEFRTSVAHTVGVFPYLPIDDRQLRIMGIRRNIVASTWPAVYSVWAVAAALTQSGLAWYAVVYFAVVTVLTQSAISLLLAEGPIARLLGWLSDNAGFGKIFLVFPVAAIGILFFPEKYWPDIGQFSLFAWIWPPVWPTLFLAQSPNWGFAFVGIILTVAAIPCCCLLAVLLKRRLDQDELLEFMFNSYHANSAGDGATDECVMASILPKEALKFWRVAPTMVSEADKARFDPEEYLEKYYSAEGYEKEVAPALSVLPEANQPESLFRTLLKFVHTQEDLRLLSISRTCNSWESDLLDVPIRTWLPRVLFWLLVVVLVPKSWLFLFVLPACYFATKGILPDVLFDNLQPMHLLPIDPRGLIRAETKYRLTCLVPVVIAAVLIGSVCAFREGAAWGQVFLFSLKAILAVVVAMPAIVALVFVSTLNSSWTSTYQLWYGITLILSMLMGVAGISMFFFPFYGAELLGVIPAALASRYISSLCIGWYETAPTDVAPTS